MTAGKKGRKPLNRGAEYYKGYHTGFQRIARKKAGMASTMKKQDDAKRSKDWLQGLKDGIAAGQHRYFPHSKRR